MCLITNQSKPFIASHDIECYKMLQHRITKGYITPFMNSTILFKNGVCVQQCDKFGIEDGINNNKWYIFEGIHSTIYDIFDNFYCYKIAIIPKGTQYYVGNDNDLVSLKLIIFKNKFRYWIYKIFHK